MYLEFFNFSYCENFLLIDINYGFKFFNMKIEFWFLKLYIDKIIDMDFNKVDKNYMYIIVLGIKSEEDLSKCVEKVRELIK